MSWLFHTVFYDPIYNALVALVSFVPGSDVGIAVILITIIINLILLPFALSAARTQRAMKEIEPKLKEVKEKYKDDKEGKGAIATLALYREAKIIPFASILMVIVQIPVLLALAWVFFKEPFPEISSHLLYSFTPVPETISLYFLGLIPVMGKSLILSALAAAAQYLQARLALAGTMQPTKASGFQGDFQRIMSLQLKYVFPILIAVISYTTSSAIALYFITTSLVGALRELHVRRAPAKDTVIS